MCYNRSMKTCNKCNTQKDLSEFQVCSKNKDGYTGMCKPCKRNYDNEYYKKSDTRKSQITENRKEARKAIRRWLWNYLLDNPCVDCGEPDPIVLDFDHIRDKRGNVSQMLNTSLRVVIEEVNKCEVRCSNCHRRKTAKDFNWYATIA